MKNGETMTWRSIKIGIVVTLSIALLFLAVVNSDLLKGLLSHNVALYARAPVVNGLRIGAPVWLQGIEIGSVRSLSLRPEDVVIKLSLERSALVNLKKDAEASISTMGLLGDKFMELSRGTSDKPFLRAGDTITGRMAPGLDQVLETSAGSVHLVEEFIRKLDTIAGKAASGKGLIGTLLTDTILYHRINYIAGVIAKNVIEYDTGMGTVKRLLTDDALYKVAVKAAEQVDTLGLKVNNGSGALARLANDSSIYINLNRAVIHLQSLEDTVARAAASVNRLTNTQLSSDLIATVSQLKGLIEDIKKNPHRYVKISIF